MTWRLICKYCDGTPEAHHDFEPKMPPGCVCSPVEWMSLLDGTIPMPCGKFTSHYEVPDGVCGTCEHDRACHAPTPDRRTAPASDAP